MLNNILLKNEWVIQEIKEENKKKKHTIVQNLWDAVNVVLKGNYVAIKAY